MTLVDDSVWIVRDLVIATQSDGLLTTRQGTATEIDHCWLVVDCHPRRSWMRLRLRGATTTTRSHRSETTTGRVVRIPNVNKRHPVMALMSDIKDIKK